MTININELRQALWAVKPEEVLELIDRLEAAEKAAAEAYQRGYATGQEEIEAERDALQAKIAEMERQEPVAWLHDDGRFVWRETAPHEINYADCKMAFYALPGAQGE